MPRQGRATVQGDALKTFLNCGFGSLIGEDDLALIKSLGFDGVRQDVRRAEDARPLAAELARAGLSAILVLDPAVWPAAAAVPFVAETGCDAAFEIGNELDGVMDARAYALSFARVEQGIRSVQPDATIITAGTRSLRRECVDWIRTLVNTGMVSPRACVGYHTYRSTAPGVPCEGYARREDEYAALRDAARGRRLWLTEIGWSTAPRPKRGFLGIKCGGTWRYTDDEVAGFLDYELRLNRDQGSESFVVYQLSDGPTDTNEHRFGIRDTAGALKPSAHVVGRYR